MARRDDRRAIFFWSKQNVDRNEEEQQEEQEHLHTGVHRAALDAI